MSERVKGCREPEPRIVLLIWTIEHILHWKSQCIGENVNCKMHIYLYFRIIFACSPSKFAKQILCFIWNFSIKVQIQTIWTIPTKWTKLFTNICNFQSWCLDKSQGIFNCLFLGPSNYVNNLNLCYGQPRLQVELV